MKCKKFLCLILSILMLVSIAPLSAFAYEKEADFSEDVDFINSYEELKNCAFNSHSDVTYVLDENIYQSDDHNDMEIVIGSGVFNLDLNGYTIYRETTGADRALFRIKSGAEMTIKDSSEEQTGSCVFSTGYGNYSKAVFMNSGDLTIYNGYYEMLSPFNQGYCCMVFTDKGNTYIYGGTFDSSEANGGSSIVITYDAPEYDVPHVVVFGGDFYAKYLNIEVYSNWDYINDGALYPTAYVLGGCFYITKDSDSSGFAYCNNAWGRVIVAGGTVPAKCLNARDRRFLTGTTQEYFTQTIDDYETTYCEVTPPPMIMSDQLDSNVRLQKLCDKDVVRSYSSTVYELFREEFDAIMSYTDTAVVCQDEAEQLEIELVNRTENHEAINWYVCDEDSYDGEDTEWTHIGDAQNVSWWSLEDSPLSAENMLIRCVVTYYDSEVLKIYEDMIRVVLEEEKVTTVDNVTITDLDTPVAGEHPDFEVTAEESFYINDIFWTDITDTKNKVTLKETDVFLEGHEYQLDIWVRTNDGFKFNTDSDGWIDISATVGGEEAEVILPGSKISAELTLTYKVPTTGDPTKPSEPELRILLGDADQSGKVNVKDATAIQKHVAEIDVATFSEKAADVDANGKINVKDATAIQKYVADIETGYAIGELIK